MYPVCFELTAAGATPGKRLFNLRVVMDNGLPVTQSAGTVIGVSGDCFVVRGGGRAALGLGQPVQVGDILDIAVSAKLKLRMEDGSIIAIASGTWMTILALTHSMLPASGRMRPNRWGRDCCAPWSLRLPGRRGSKSRLPLAPPRCARQTGLSRPSRAAMQVGVLSGTIAMTSNATGASITIPARWGARLEAGRNPVPPRVWSQAEFDGGDGIVNLCS